MNGFESAESLVYEVLTMIIGKVLCANNAMQVCLHKFLDEVYFREVIDGRWFDDVQDGDDLVEMLVAWSECAEESISHFH